MIQDDTRRICGNHDLDTGVRSTIPPQEEHRASLACFQTKHSVQSSPFPYLVALANVH